MLIFIALPSMVWLCLCHPLGEPWNSTRLARNTIVRDRLGHFNYEPNIEPLNLCLTYSLIFQASILLDGVCFFDLNHLDFISIGQL